jgi:hypothetical protein
MRPTIGPVTLLAGGWFGCGWVGGPGIGLLDVGQDLLELLVLMGEGVGGRLAHLVLDHGVDVDLLHPGVLRQQRHHVPGQVALGLGAGGGLELLEQLLDLAVLIAQQIDDVHGVLLEFVQVAGPYPWALATNRPRTRVTG